MNQNDRRNWYVLLGLVGALLAIVIICSGCSPISTEDWNSLKEDLRVAKEATAAAEDKRAKAELAADRLAAKFTALEQKWRDYVARVKEEFRNSRGVLPW